MNTNKFSWIYSVDALITNINFDMVGVSFISRIIKYYVICFLDVKCV